MFLGDDTKLTRFYPLRLLGILCSVVCAKKNICTQGKPYGFVMMSILPHS